ncbi:hypothetical protein DFH07DRAFT_726509 [Mycena maculata]|uniref:NmrA-like domain-containing protein n=1 Tax=Mycena maculata TaxID=230809 RepID=A0AAD7KGQ5_9AGAR|nr:hypothetical protein DFH07DRAFT_726509 [Mycena maculata]
MSSSRIVSVFGATGLQGSTVLEALLKDGTFTPRAITRNPDSEAALRLKERGVEVVEGDSSNKASLVRALQGSEAVFAITVPLLPPVVTSGPSELTQGKNMVDASKEAGVKFFIFSSLPDMTKLSGGKYTKASPADDKQVIEDYLKASGLAHASLLLGAFLENLWLLHHELKKTSIGFDLSTIIYGPTSLQSFTWIEHDLGESVLALLKSYTDPSKTISGKSYPVVTSKMTYPDLAAMISKVLGVPVTFTSLATSGIPSVDELVVFAEYDGIYTVPIPNPDLAALGAKFGTMEQFMETEVKRRYGQ